jgi:[protein-PII] uridylyltransferase
MKLVEELENLLDMGADDFTISKMFKEGIKDYKDNLSVMFESTGGKDFLVQHTKNIDSIIKLIYKSILRKYFGNYLPMRNSIPISIVALGSYGREQLALHSDIDLMIVYEDVEGYNIHAMIESFLHIAWDAKLDLGHRVHEVSDILKVSRDDITIKTALMESRFITGSTFTWNATQREIEKIRCEDSESFIKLKLEESRERRQKYPVSMQPQIKEGVGGLRDAHVLYWIAFVKYGIFSLKDLTDIVFSERQYREYRIALEFLFQVRSALHLIQGKKQDKLILELVPEVGKKLGIQDQTVLVSKTLSSMHTINRFYLVVTSKLARYLYPSPLGFKELKQTREQGGLYLINNKVYAPLRHQGFTLLELLQAFNSLPDISMEFDGSIIKLLNKLTIEKLSSKEHETFYKLFSRNHTTPFLYLFYQSANLGQLCTPLKKVHFLAQFDGYHQYPVTIHSIECVRAYEDIQDEKIEALYKSFSDEERQFLKLIVFIHDAGKGRKQDHHDVGAKIFHAYANQINLDEPMIHLGIMLIKQHTLMSRIAFREDIYHEKILFRFMSAIKTQKALDMLFVLTYADISGVGPDVFTPFNSKLLHQLYHNASEVVGNTDRLTEAAKRLKREKALKKNKEFIAFPKLRQKKVLAIESNLFFIKHTTTQIIDFVKRAIDVKEYRYYVSNEPHLCIEIYRKKELNISYLLSKLSFLNITSMDIFKLYNEMKYFRIDFDEQVTESDLLFIHEIVEKSFDLSLKVTFANPVIQANDIKLDCDHSKSYASMQINTKDQKGLLGFIMHAFEDEGVTIATAKIHTLKNRVRDQFLIEKTDRLCDNSISIIKLLTEKV